MTLEEVRAVNAEAIRILGLDFVCWIQEQPRRVLESRISDYWQAGQLEKSSVLSKMLNIRDHYDKKWDRAHT